MHIIYICITVAVVNYILNVYTAAKLEKWLKPVMSRWDGNTNNYFDFYICGGRSEEKKHQKITEQLF